MSAPGASARDPKKKKSEARALLIQLLTRLKQECESLERIEQWYERVHELESILQEYADVIPADVQRRLDQATHVTDSTRMGLQKACSLLKQEVVDAIAALPAGTLLAPVLAAALVGLVIVVGAGVTYLNLTAVQLTIVNNGCAPIVLGGQLPFLQWVGIEMPESIPTNGRGTAKLPQVSANLDATETGTIKLSLLGYTRPIAVASDLRTATLNGASLLGQRLSVNLGQQLQNELVLTCGQ